MDRATIDPAIKSILTEIARLTADAACIGKAAEACVFPGSMKVSMEIEQIVYEVGRLQDAASLLNRLAAD